MLDFEANKEEKNCDQHIDEHVLNLLEADTTKPAIFRGGLCFNGFLRCRNTAQTLLGADVVERSQLLPYA